jgi:hypothetical protein
MCPRVDSASKNEYHGIPWGWRRPVREADDLPPSWCRTSRKSGTLTYPEPPWANSACCGRHITDHSRFMSVYYYTIWRRQKTKLNTWHMTKTQRSWKVSFSGTKSNLYIQAETIIWTIFNFPERTTDWCYRPGLKEGSGRLKGEVKWLTLRKISEVTSLPKQQENISEHGKQRHSLLLYRSGLFIYTGIYLLIL